MSQLPVVMSFRKRLSNRGYQSISICKLKSGNYCVSALEPLSSQRVSVEMSLYQLFHSMR